KKEIKGKTAAAERGKQRFSEHLIALRGMLIGMAIVILVCFIAVFYLFCAPLTSFILRPVTERGIQVIATKVSESLMMQIKLSLVAALVIGMPVIIWQVWRFVAPALYPKEKKLFLLMFGAMVLLFASG